MSSRVEIAAAACASLLRLGLGFSYYWTSPALAHLGTKESKFQITPDEGSWIVSLLSIGGVIGYLLYPQLVDRIGRKYTMLIFSIPQIISWLLIFFATNVYYLYAARLLAGIGYFGGYVLEIIYVGEISSKNIRGLLVILGKIAFVTGSLITVTAGAFLSYQNMNLLLLSLSFLFIITSPLIQESPYFYLKIDKEKAALKSLSKLRGIKDSKELKVEIRRMKEDIVKDQISKKYPLRKIFESNKHRKTLLIAFLATISVQFSGALTIAAYSQRIVTYTGFSLKPEYTTIILTFVVLVSSILISPLPDFFGRRILTLIFGIIGALSSIVVGCFFFFKDYVQVEEISSFSWIALVALATHNIACTAGLMSLSVVIAAELFPVEIKSTALSALYITSDFLGFFVKLGFDRAVSTIGVYGVFWVFAGFSLILPLINVYIMPETKGKTLEEIQKVMDKKE